MTTVCPNVSRSVKFEKEAVDLVAVVRIEVARGFVGQQHGRRVDQRPRDGHTLLLTAGELPRLVVAACREAHQVEQFAGAPLDLGTRPPADQPGDADVLEGRELGQQVVELEDEADPLVAEAREVAVAQGEGIAAVDLDAARVGTRQRADDLQQRGLARAAGPDDRDYLAVGDLERDAPQHLERTEALVDIRYAYHGCVV